MTLTNIETALIQSIRSKTNALDVAIQAMSEGIEKHEIIPLGYGDYIFYIKNRSIIKIEIISSM